MKNILPHLSDEMAELYNNSSDYMKMGKWMMFRIDNKRMLDDLKKIIEVKLPIKI